MSENIVLTNICCKICGVDSDVKETKEGGYIVSCPNKCKEPKFFSKTEVDAMQEMAEEIFKESEERAKKKKAN
jgi:hypothetical protein